MSYEKLGFTSGQTLKAEHLNHMEEGIANAGGGAGFVYYTGNVEMPSDYTNRFVLSDLTVENAVKNYYEIEVGFVLHGSSNNSPFCKRTFIFDGVTTDLLVREVNAVENGSAANDPTAKIEQTNDNIAVQLRAGTGSYAIPIYNPSIVYIRMYPRG